MTDICPGALWPSISPIVETTGDAFAPPIDERDELAEGHGEAVEQVEVNAPAPAHSVPGPPEAHAEVRPPRLSRRPVLPTKAEVDEHPLTPELQIVVRALRRWQGAACAAHCPAC